MFVNSYRATTLSEAYNVFQQMVPGVQRLYVNIQIS